eukprot:Nk52_evm23s224 gene=Nk52_evmTU23s224
MRNRSRKKLVTACSPAGQTSIKDYFMRGRKRFLITSVPLEEAKELCKQICELGGVVLESTNFVPSCTHVIAGQPSRKGKFLGGCAKGCWVLKPSYIKDCVEKKKWLAETLYEWNCTSVKPIISSGNDETSNIGAAPRFWRKKRANMNEGPFSGWKCCLIGSKSNLEHFKLLLVSGSASVEYLRVPLDDETFSKSEFNNYFVLDPSEKQKSFIMSYLDGEALLDPTLIPDFIAEKGKICKESYILPDFSHVSENENDKENVRVPDSNKSFILNQKDEKEHNIKEKPPVVDVKDILDIVEIDRSCDHSTNSLSAQGSPKHSINEKREDIYVIQESPERIASKNDTASVGVKSSVHQDVNSSRSTPVGPIPKVALAKRLSEAEKGQSPPRKTPKHELGVRAERKGKTVLGAICDRFGKLKNQIAQHVVDNLKMATGTVAKPQLVQEESKKPDKKDDTNCKEETDCVIAESINELANGDRGQLVSKAKSNKKGSLRKHRVSEVFVNSERLQSPGGSKCFAFVEKCISPHHEEALTFMVIGKKSPAEEKPRKVVLCPKEYMNSVQSYLEEYQVDKIPSIISTWSLSTFRPDIKAYIVMLTDVMFEATFTNSSVSTFCTLKWMQRLHPWEDRALANIFKNSLLSAYHDYESSWSFLEAVVRKCVFEQKTDCPKILAAKLLLKYLVSVLEEEAIRVCGANNSANLYYLSPPKLQQDEWKGTVFLCLFRRDALKIVPFVSKCLREAIGQGEVSVIQTLQELFALLYLYGESTDSYLKDYLPEHLANFYKDLDDASCKHIFCNTLCSLPLKIALSENAILESMSVKEDFIKSCPPIASSQTGKSHTTGTKSLSTVFLKFMTSLPKTEKHQKANPRKESKPSTKSRNVGKLYQSPEKELADPKHVEELIKKSSNEELFDYLNTHGIENATLIQYAIVQGKYECAVRLVRSCSESISFLKQHQKNDLYVNLDKVLDKDYRKRLEGSIKTHNWFISCLDRFDNSNAKLKLNKEGNCEELVDSIASMIQCHVSVLNAKCQSFKKNFWDKSRSLFAVNSLSLTFLESIATDMELLHNWDLVMNCFEDRLIKVYGKPKLTKSVRMKLRLLRTYDGFTLL